MKWPSLFLWLALAVTGARAATVDEISRLVGAGHWQAARTDIADELQQTNLPFQTRQDLMFQRDRMARRQFVFQPVELEF